MEEPLFIIKQEIKEEIFSDYLEHTNESFNTEIHIKEELLDVDTDCENDCIVKTEPGIVKTEIEHYNSEIVKSEISHIKTEIENNVFFSETQPVGYTSEYNEELINENTEDICITIKEIKCPMCGKGFDSLFLTKAHIGQHMRVKGTCWFCGLEFIDRESFANHFTIPKEFKSLEDSIHLSCATSSLDYKCKFCLKRFADSEEWQKHAEFHKETIYQCEHCLKVFPGKTNLTRHQRREKRRNKLLNDTQMQKWFVCQICNKKYLTKSNLQRHLKVSCMKDDQVEVT